MVARFKVGDRIVGNKNSPMLVGLTGTISRIDYFDVMGNIYHEYYVDFDHQPALFNQGPFVDFIFDLAPDPLAVLNLNWHQYAPGVIDPNFYGIDLGVEKAASPGLHVCMLFETYVGFTDTFDFCSVCQKRKAAA